MPIDSLHTFRSHGARQVKNLYLKQNIYRKKKLSKNIIDY